MNTIGSLWYVQLGDGDVHRVTLDQLDEGFQAGHIDAKTMVLAAGATRWTTLGQIAGLDDFAAPPAKPLDAARHPAADVAPAPAKPPPYPARPAYAAPHAFVPPPVSVAPAPLLPSHRPVSIDLSDLELAAGLPARSGKRWLAGLVVITAIAGLGAGVVKRPELATYYCNRLGLHGIAMKFSRGTVMPPQPAATAPPTPVTAVIAAPVLTPQAATAAPATTAKVSPSASPQDPGLSDRAGDHPKERPPGAVKQLGPRTKARKTHAQTAPSHGALPSKSPTFTTGGNHYDPLNSNI